MSLLMQALKKAEHAKQKQGAAPADAPAADPGDTSAPDDALSLSPREMPADSAEDGIGTLGESKHSHPDSLLSALSLSPQSEENSGESITAGVDPESRPAALSENIAKRQDQAPAAASGPQQRDECILGRSNQR